MEHQQTQQAAPPSVGEPAPDFTLTATDGTTVRLADLRGRPVILYFYPKDDTPGCTTEACSFRDAWPRVEQRGVVVLGISRDDVASHQRFTEKFHLPFPLLADVNGEVTRRYGAWGERTSYGKTSMGVLRTTFYIRSDGTVGHVWQKVKAEGHAADVLAFLGTQGI